ncbi:diaminobutyrate acetyltransferase [Futiania mangrovi]|uniref:L-2,4-diaminobutyric acid acetyltransferase n=1 Tax=Futiania mangrovi TaxID=2959716 RepID=A0A9J6PCS6_9PROT|nr:diaminobutyrate acetyltransferase [Futiania mangrovii]MCP1336369.1 diaminobutyrate acetyltransferase [Futiania mangrovii]
MHLAQIQTSTTTPPKDEIRFRMPEEGDGAQIWALVKESTLDDNSMYCNLLQCTHFADTCAVAEMDGEIVGWVSGYIPPQEPDVLFIWQVCVSEKARGRGLAKKLILSLLHRPACAEVRRIRSTITADNQASWALFGSVAEKLGTVLTRRPHFTRDNHFDGAHATEHLVTIGPFEQPKPLEVVRAA